MRKNNPIDGKTHRKRSWRGRILGMVLAVMLLLGGSMLPPVSLSYASEDGLTAVQEGNSGEENEREETTQEAAKNTTEASKESTAEETTKAAETQKETTKAAETQKETTKAAETQKETTKAAETQKETTKAAETQKETTKAAETQKETTKAAETKKETTKAAETQKETTKETESVEAPAISATTLELAKGKTGKLKISGTLKSVTWSTSAQNILSLSGTNKGTVKVTGLAYGSGKVKAQVVTDSGKTTFSCKVKVYDPTLSETEIDLLKGKTKQLSVKQCSGEKKWSSSSGSVASVADGLVQAKTVGTAEIKVKVNKVTVSCKVHVYDPELDCTEKRVQQNESFTVKVNGLGEAKTVPEWSVSDSKVLSVNSSGKVTAVGTGDAEVICKVGEETLKCYVIVDRTGIEKKFPGTSHWSKLGISSLKAAALGSSSRYRIIQGSCTDGKYLYALLMDSGNSGKDALVQIRLSNLKITRVVEDLKLYHANDVTWNEDRNRLVVCCGIGNYKKLVYMDTINFRITGEKVLDREVYGISYQHKYKKYVLALRGEDTLQIRDGSWKVVREFRILRDVPYTRQAIDCDKSYIYVIQSRISEGETRIMVYNWSGKYQTTVMIAGNVEAESLCHVGQHFYIAANDAEFSGGQFYETSLRNRITVRYDGGEGKVGYERRIAETVVVGSKAVIYGNKVRRKGYTFTGWSVTRSTDGASLYKKNGKEKWYVPGKQPKGWKLSLRKSGSKISTKGMRSGDQIVLIAKWKKQKTKQKK